MHHDLPPISPQEKEAPRPDLRVARHLQLLRPTDRAAPLPAAEEELGDDFYELTEEDLKKLALTAGAGGADARGGGPLQTAAMRELARLSQVRIYSRAGRLKMPSALADDSGRPICLPGRGVGSGLAYPPQRAASAARKLAVASAARLRPPPR